MQTGLSSWVLAIIKSIEDANIDADTLCRKIGMDASKIGDLTYRYSQEQVTALWIAASKATADPVFGLKVARHVRPSTFHVVGYAMSCSETLRRAGERFARYSRIISDAAIVRFQTVEDGVSLSVELKPLGERPVYHTIDTILAGYHHLCEWIVGAEVVPLAVHLQHRAPGDPQPYGDVFHCPIVFDQPRNEIIYSNKAIDQNIPSANEELAHVLDEMAANHIDKRQTQRFSSMVRQALLGQLPRGFPSRKKTAILLGITERTLLRRLGDEGTTFQDVLERLRESLSFDYLRRPELTSEEIAFLLGFSSNSSFSRAFMRWTGERPSEWRERVNVRETAHPPEDGYPAGHGD
ncbi:AraC family transcriptional regulator [uncultured Croceicoccus sp.]|uniref:AraC family transcriptional regulator n=1 Tax=uncultured Croceicoccus sp. TaxID=1295329 RepID=UPI00261946E6|nr:AraC family transcriptional regulator [uncultured Croceicoccus sp.]